MIKKKIITLHLDLSFLCTNEQIAWGSTTSSWTDANNHLIPRPENIPSEINLLILYLSKLTQGINKEKELSIVNSIDTLFEEEKI